MPIPGAPAWLPDLRGPHLTQRLCFFHVPKCAGLSMVSSMRKKYRLSDHLRGRLAAVEAGPSRRAAHLQGVDLVEYRKSLLSYYLANDGLLFVTGHVGCTTPMIDAYRDTWTFTTILRDPVARFLSEYFYNRFKESDHFKTDLELAAYLDDDAGRASAGTYLNFFSGLPRAAPDDERIEDALGNLRRFDLVGWVEDLQDYRRRFAALTGVTLRDLRNNVNPAPQYDDQRKVSSEVLAKIESLCAGDIELVRRLQKAGN